MYMTIGRNRDTARLERDNRFIIDDPDARHKIAYKLTKPLKVGTVFNQEGVFKFVIQECATTDFDNLELMIADYYKHFDRNGQVLPEPAEGGAPGEGREVLL